MIELLLRVTRGYAVTFERSNVGDFFCLLRVPVTGELVHCAGGDSPEDALRATAEWLESSAPGNGTASRPEASHAGSPTGRL